MNRVVYEDTSTCLLIDSRSSSRKEFADTCLRVNVSTIQRFFVKRRELTTSPCLYVGGGRCRKWEYKVRRQGRKDFKNCFKACVDDYFIASSSTDIVIKCFFIIFSLLQTRTVRVVSEETKKQLDQMITQNKELEDLLAKSRSDYNAKVRRHKPSLFAKRPSVIR